MAMQAILSQRLKKTLLYPLLGLAILAFAAANLVPWQGLFVNLGTTFLGIIITVGYVDITLQRHDTERWTGTLARVGKRLENVANASCAQFRGAFGIPPTVIRADIIALGSDRDRRTELLRVTLEIVRPSIQEKIPSIDELGWRTLGSNLHNACQAIGLLVQQFGMHLEPEVLSTLMDMDDRMRSILTRYQTFPDVLGVPLNRLAPNNLGESSEPFQRELQDMVGRDCDALMVLCGSLYRQIDALPTTT